MRQAFLGVLLAGAMVSGAGAQEATDTPQTTAGVVVINQKDLPITELETMERLVGVVVVKSTQQQPTLGGDDGSGIVVSAVRMTAEGQASREGIEIRIIRGGRAVSGYVDAEDVKKLIDGLEAMSKIDRRAGTLDTVDARFQVGGLTVQNRDDGGAREAQLRVVHYGAVTGDVTWASASIRGIRLLEIRRQVIAAQAVLDAKKPQP